MSRGSANSLMKRRTKGLVSKDDIKKAVLSANNKLKSQNKELEVNLKSVKQEIKKSEDEKKNLLVDLKNTSDMIKSAKDNLSSIDADLNSSKTKLSMLSSSIEVKNKEFADINIAINSSTKKNKSLEKSILILQSRKSEFTVKVKDIKEIDIKINKGTKELVSIEGDINKLQEELASFEIIKKAEKLKLDEYSGKLANERSLINNSMAKMTADLEKATSSHNELMRSFKEDLADKNNDISVLNSIIKKKENEYTVVAANVEVLNNRVSVAEDNIKRAEDAELQAVDKVRSDFEKWKLVALEQVAKLKLKSRIETIDKAGLMSILNG